MRAVVIHQFGDPRQLKIEEVPTPDPHGDEVLVAVHAASINPSDVKNVAGKMHGTTLPRIPGRDFAGIIARGPGDLVGREVWGTGGDVGFTRDGAHAEFILLRRTAVTVKPPGISMEAAGGAGVTFVTAWSALVTAAQVTSGETVVIVGAAGGVGSAAVQIAKSCGARVIGAVQSDDDLGSVRQDGADHAINIKLMPIVAAVQAVTGKRGADVVFDTSGMMFAEAVEIAAMDGRVPVITAPADGNATFNLRALYRKTLRVLGVDTRRLDAVACATLLEQMLPGFKSGAYRPKAGEPYPLSRAIEAYEKAADGGGRILLRPNMP